MSVERIDVLCIGLGPAGARAAAAAAARGLRVVGVDRRREAGVPVQCAELVPGPLGTEVAGLAKCVRQRIEAMQTFVGDEPPDRTAPFPGSMIDRAEFDALLVREAARAGADCRFGVAVRAILADGTVGIGKSVRLAPRVIVGADGPRSVAGRAIGHVNEALVETRQLTVPLRSAHDATDIYLSARIRGGYGWLFPKGAVAHIGAGVEPARRHALKRIVDALHRRLVDEGRVGVELLALTGGAIPVGGPVAPRGSVGTVPVILAGDAAGLTNPVTGAGIAAAVRSGTLAGEAAADFLAGEQRALERYAEDLDDLFGASLGRALRRRAELLSSLPEPAALRRGWIAYPQYWEHP
jgi:digeranylgeranylglycerophospholipid reductase